MRKWIVEETGESRPPKAGEWFISDCGDFMFMAQQFRCTDRVILKRTEITDVRITEVTPKSWAMLVDNKAPSFDEWNW